MDVFRIADLVKPHGPVSRSTLYKHAREGRIALRKRGGSTVVLASDWSAYVAGEPINSAAKAA